MIYSSFERAALEKMFYRIGDDFWILNFDLLRVTVWETRTSKGTGKLLSFKIDEIWYEGPPKWDKTFYVYSIFKKNFAALIQGQIHKM